MPLDIIVAPPSLDTFPPEVAVVYEIAVTVDVVVVGVVALSFLHE
jgi:hypothetical protein